MEGGNSIQGHGQDGSQTQEIPYHQIKDPQKLSSLLRHKFGPGGYEVEVSVGCE